MPVRIRVREREAPRTEATAPHQVQFGKRLTDLEFPPGLPSADEIAEELFEYCNVLLGRAPSPLDSPYLSLAEVAGIYHARARELEMLIYDAERKGDVVRGSPHYRLRTGQLTSFIEMTKRMYDLGSRRLSQEQLLTQQRTL